MTLKKELQLGSVLAAVVVVIAAYYSWEYSKETASLAVTTNQGAANPVEIVLNNAEISKHSTSKDCWIVVSGDVFAVTQYIALHPGGSQRIIDYCGKDATTAFNTRGGTGRHSGVAKSDLLQLRIGALNGTTSSNAIQGATAQPRNFIGGEDDD